MSRIYNHRKDIVDHRDHKFELHVLQVDTLPIKIDLRTTGFVPVVLNQGELGSCSANGASNALRFCLEKEHGIVIQPSRLFIYYFTRLIEGTINEDSGACIRDVMKEINTYGACSETLVPYDITKFAVHPPTSAVRSAQSHCKGFKYLSVQQNLSSIKNALNAGFPIILGIQVYDSFETQQVSQTGIVPMPDVNTESCLGGHCVTCYGYSEDDKTFLFMNSWGTEWGQQGFFTLPFAYVLNSDFTSDLWTIKVFT
jgi:C1A family cysteine protease